MSSPERDIARARYCRPCGSWRRCSSAAWREPSPGRAWPRRCPAAPGQWPWATFLVNVAGAFVLGLVIARGVRGYRRELLGAGFCGALTTFSTLQLELLGMLDAGRVALALAYAGASIAAGLAATALAGRATV